MVVLERTRPESKVSPKNGSIGTIWNAVLNRLGMEQICVEHLCAVAFGIFN